MICEFACKNEATHIFVSDGGQQEYLCRLHYYLNYWTAPFKYRLTLLFLPVGRILKNIGRV